MKKGKPPCATCEKQGCGAYHDICPDYQDWLNNEIQEVKPISRIYIPERLWKSRGKLLG